eukprot:3496914-Karenia_brevis.AAC.1
MQALLAKLGSSTASWRMEDWEVLGVGRFPWEEPALVSSVSVQSSSVAEQAGSVAGMAAVLKCLTHVCQLFPQRHSQEWPATDLAQAVHHLDLAESKIKKLLHSLGWPFGHKNGLGGLGGLG